MYFVDRSSLVSGSIDMVRHRSLTWNFLLFLNMVLINRNNFFVLHS